MRKYNVICNCLNCVSVKEAENSAVTLYDTYMSTIGCRNLRNWYGREVYRHRQET